MADNHATLLLKKQLKGEGLHQGATLNQGPNDARPVDTHMVAAGPPSPAEAAVRAAIEAILQLPHLPRLPNTPRSPRALVALALLLALSAELTKNPVEGFSAGLAEDNLFEWQVTIIGPPETL